MAASDPTTDVPTPTGTLQGVAAFSWDGTNWQPTGRAGPSVATPTGVLQGVAPFSWDGTNWQASGLAQPGVATPTGVLQGVAVYTWSGSAWGPIGGTATPATPTGALRGVAAFNWDGSVWQPSAQARPSVPTPYGVLDGVAMFGWNGSAWAAVAPPALNISFMAPGSLDARLTFARASTGTYFDAIGTMRTGAINAPRWDYDPNTHALRGLLIEDARTNVALGSPGFSATYWSFPVGGGSVAFNTSVAPDGTTTGSTQTKTGTAEGVFRYAVSIPATNVTYCSSVFVKRGTAPYANLVGVSTATSFPMIVLRWSDLSIAIRTGVNTPTAYGMSPAGNGWYRLWISAPNATSGTSMLFDIRAAGDSAAGMGDGTESGTLFIWGGQLETGAFPTSYIPTAAAAVTRAVDSCVIPPANMAGWYVSPGGSWQAEFIMLDPTPSAGLGKVIAYPAAVANVAQLFVGTGNTLAQYDGAAIQTANLATSGAITKGASTWSAGTGRICLSGGAIVSGAMATGYAAAVTAGLAFLQTGISNQSITGYMRSARYWPRILSDAELQSVTT